MATLLHLDSSADLTGSVSRRLTARFATGWAALGHATVRRDLFSTSRRTYPATCCIGRRACERPTNRWIRRMTATRRSWSVSCWPPTSSWSAHRCTTGRFLDAEGLDRLDPRARDVCSGRP